MKKTFRSVFISVLLVLLPLSGLVAQAQPTEISIVTVTNAKDTIDNTNIIWKEIEKRTNTKLSITFVPVSNYPDKLAVILASGNLPDLLFLDNPQNPLALKVMSQGAFWDLSKLYKQYKELASYPEDSWLNTKGLDGKNYVVPRPRPLIGQMQTMAFRQDWLDKLKLKMPETPDELYKTLKAFVNDDPDGNGVKDTDGLVGSNSNDGVFIGPFSTVLTMFTGNTLGNYLELKNGKLMPAFTNPDFKAGMAYLTKLYAEGLIHRDFAIMKQQQMRDTGMSGKVGAILEGFPGATVVTTGLQKVVPTGSFTPVTYLKTV